MDGQPVPVARPAAVAVKVADVAHKAALAAAAREAALVAAAREAALATAEHEAAESRLQKHRSVRDDLPGDHRTI